MAWKEKDFEESMHPAINAVYTQLFKNKLVEIYRSDRSLEKNSKMLFMDIELAIDTHLTFIDGSVITFQEKSIKSELYYKYGECFTFEYYNDPKTKDEGEWFKLAAQLYFYGIADVKTKTYCKYYIINIVKLRTGLMNKFTIKELESRKYLRYNPPPAKANFFAIPFNILREMPGVVVYEYDKD